MSISADPMSGATLGEIQGVTSGRSYPYLIQAGVKLKIWNVQVEIHGPITGTGPKVRGTQGTFNVPEATLDHVSGVVYEAYNIEVSTAFPAVTAFYNTFDIHWEVSRDGSNWEDAGTSSNQIYVCLRDPLTNLITMYRTAVHLACKDPGASLGPTAAAKTWALFTSSGGPSNVKTWDEKTLYYYEPGRNFLENTDSGLVTLKGLLTMRRGQCGAWCLLLQHAWAINGVSSTHVTATCTGADGFWVTDWDDLSTAHPFWFQGSGMDMIPTPLPGNPFYYYDNPSSPAYFLNKNTIKGQGTAGGSNCPSEKVFQNHQFLCYGGTYHDPSYGVTYSSQADFQSHLAGWATVNSGGANLKFDLHNFSGTIVHFDHTC